MISSGPYSPARLALLPAARYRVTHLTERPGDFAQGSDNRVGSRMDAPALPSCWRNYTKSPMLGWGLPALSRCLELLLDEGGIVVPLLCLEHLLQPEQMSKPTTDTMKEAACHAM